MSRISLTVFNDPGCPWGYSAIPALRVLEWRYGAQLKWRLVLIGLTDDAGQYAARGYTPLRGAQGQVGFRRYGMPFDIAPKARISATARACRAVIAARLQQPGSEWAVHRALQLAYFTTPLVLEDDEELAEALTAAGFDGAAIVGALDTDEVTAAYEADKAETRTAAGTAGALQGKTANTDGAERYTAPSVRFEAEGRTPVEATGFQPVEAYDVLVANLDPTLERRAPAASALAVLEGLAGSASGPEATTQEVAAIMAAGNDAPDRDRAELELLELVDAGKVTRRAIGDGGTWRVA